MATTRKGQRTSGQTTRSGALPKSADEQLWNEVLLKPRRTWVQVSNAMLSRGIRTNEKAVRRVGCLAMRKLRKALSPGNAGKEAEHGR